MNIKVLLNLYKNRKFADSRTLATGTLIRYYVRLKIGEISKRIYKYGVNSSTPEFSNTKEALKILEDSIRNTLNEIDLGNVIDIKKKIGFEHIGVGCVLTPAMFGNLIALSQNDTSFYFMTENAREYTLEVNLFAVASVSGHIKFEEEIIKSFSIPTLTEHKISLKIKPELITRKLSKIAISVNKCWSPNFLDKELPDFPLGVGVMYMSLH